MTGTWFNPTTGHKFTVRDSFFQDGQFVVQTMDGQMLDYNTIQNYVQVNDENGRPAQPDNQMLNQAKKAPAKATELPPEVAEMLLPEDNVQVNGLGNIYSDKRPTLTTQAPTEPEQSPVSAPTDVEFAMISRVLDGRPEPMIDATITWDCPEEQIRSLVDTLGVDPAKIAEYYISHMNQNLVFEQIKTKFTMWLIELFTEREEELIVAPEPEKPAATPKKQAKKPIKKSK